MKKRKKVSPEIFNKVKLIQKTSSANNIQMNLEDIGKAVGISGTTASRIIRSNNYEEFRNLQNSYWHQHENKKQGETNVSNNSISSAVSKKPVQKTCPPVRPLRLGKACNHEAEIKHIITMQEEMLKLLQFLYQVSNLGGTEEAEEEHEEPKVESPTTTRRRGFFGRRVK